ncbi:MAG TPA: sporulation protein YabP, partial [Bacillaceae bacterium]|nr:sporulation protein YabP [Bacillaceae bacterium]
MNQQYEPIPSKGTVPEHDVTMRGRRILDITGVK